MLTEINGRHIKPLITEEQIRARVCELGAEISTDYRGKTPLLIGVLKGSFIFLSDLVRHIDLDLEVDFLRLTSYGKSDSPGKIELVQDIMTPTRGKDVIVVEDLFDTGATAEFIKDRILSTEPRSFKICALINKLERRESAIGPDYVGFQIDKGFIVGYGTDYAERARNLPGIYVMD